jgi:hypothetical protein
MLCNCYKRYFLNKVLTPFQEPISSKLGATIELWLISLVPTHSLGLVENGWTIK